MSGHIILSHGSDSGPDATKVAALAAIAESLGWRTSRPDYREEDKLGYAGAVPPRLARLLAAIDSLDAPPVLLGSSMGAFVSGLASLRRPVAGVFLLATPGAIPGVEEPFDTRPGVPTLMMHGWQDDVCFPHIAIEYATRRRLPLLMVDDDHRLISSMGVLEDEFRAFLARVVAAA